jgi:WD40 repeat protein
LVKRSGHTDIVTRVRFSPDGRSFLSFGYDNTVRVWSPAGEAPLRVFAGHGGIEEAEYIERGHRIVSTGDDGQLLAWSPGGHDVTVLFAHGSPLTALEVLGDRGVKSLFLCDCLKGKHQGSSSVMGQAAAA